MFLKYAQGFQLHVIHECVDVHRNRLILVPFSRKTLNNTLKLKSNDKWSIN